MNSTEFQKAAEDKILKLIDELNPLEKNLLYRQLNRADGLSMDGIDRRIEKLARELASKTTSLGEEKLPVVKKATENADDQLPDVLIYQLGKILSDIDTELKNSQTTITQTTVPKQLEFQFPPAVTGGTYVYNISGITTSTFTLPTITVDTNGNVILTASTVSFM